MFFFSPEDIERFKKQMALKSVEKDNELEPKELEDKLSIKEVKEELPNGTMTNGSLETNNSEMALPLDWGSEIKWKVWPYMQAFNQNKCREH